LFRRSPASRRVVYVSFRFTPSSVCALRLPDVYSGGGGDPNGDLSLTAWIPERFCGVNITGQALDVYLQSVVEAAVSISTSGGAVSVGSIKATDAAITTGGGSLTGSGITAYSVEIDTAGGALALKRLVGREIRAATGGGGAELGVVYGDRVSLSAGGGAVSINSIKVADGCAVESGGGAVAIDGLDGAAAIVSGGGRVEVQMHAEARSAEIDSGGGDVSVSVPSGCAFELEASGGRGVRLGPGLRVDGEASPKAARGTLTAPSQPREGGGRGHGAASGNSWREAGLWELKRIRAPEEAAREEKATRGRLRVDAGAGEAAFDARSWMDSIAQRFAAARGG